MSDSLILSIFDKGGFFVYPILACSIIALSIFLKKFYFTRDEQIVTKVFTTKLESYFF